MFGHDEPLFSMSGVDNIIAALEQGDLVCDITLNVSDWMMDAIVPAMLGQFPALKSIVLDVGDGTMAVVPSSFLGGSAPQLQWLTLYAIPFPALLTLLSSTKNLVDLQLSGISRSGYISPEAMVTFFSAMPKLGSLRFQFESPQSFPDHEGRRHPPLARSTLPALGELVFEGVNEYFEDFVAWIDTPMIRILEITFFRRHFYNFSQLSQLMGRVEVFKSPARADIRFFGGFARISFSSRTDEPAPLSLGISCNELHLQLRYLVQVFNFLLPFSNTESLTISGGDQLRQSQWGPTAENLLLLDLLRPFSAVRDLHLDNNNLTPVAYALNEVVEERITEMFPAIRGLFIGKHLPSRPVLRAIEKFATARELFTRLDRPHRWVAD